MLKRTAHAIRAFLSRLALDRRGVSAVFLAVSLIPTIGAVGLAVDSSLGYLLRTRLSKALDAAGLAAGRIALDDNVDVQAIARQYFDANFGTGAGDVELVDFDYDLDETEHFVTLTAEARMPTYFMRVFGHDEMLVSARTVIERQTTGMELALILDNTGSMQNGDKFATMQQSAYDLVDGLYNDGEDTVENLWVSVVPFVASVNVGSSHTGWLPANDRANNNPTSFGSPLRAWKGCVLARSLSNDTDDSPPSSGRFTSYYWSNASPSSSDHNYGCGAPILGLTASHTTVRAALEQMAIDPASAGTTTNLGLVWGWRTLSPRWRGLWGGSTPSTHPLDYNIDGKVDDNMVKVAVILTDGQNTLSRNRYSAYGPQSQISWSIRSRLDSRLTDVCRNMDNEGILIYSIMFGTDTDQDARDLFEDCATTPAMYYYAETNDDLVSAFRSIGGQLANLRIVQ